MTRDERVMAMPSNLPDALTWYLRRVYPEVLPLKVLQACFASWRPGYVASCCGHCVARGRIVRLVDGFYQGMPREDPHV